MKPRRIVLVKVRLLTRTGVETMHFNTPRRGTSKDIVVNLDKRVAGVETSMPELKTQVEGLEGLDYDFMSMREDFRVALNTLSGDLMREICGVRDMFMDEIMKIRTEFGEEVSTLHQTIEDLQADVALCKRSLASGGGNTNHGPKLDVPKPSPFVGSGKLGWLMIFCGRWNNIWKVSMWWMMRSSWRPDT
ncbi:hypothetical protein Tco_0924782 [Tanacetum coccineum]|uniref:Uncharacterized protein n=1 Tax=Tanacetum coccineum TaxID=301880 RepID=A0ABQ5D7V4_9ASTR